MASSPWGMQGWGLPSQKDAQETCQLMDSANGCFLKATCVPGTDLGMRGNKKDKKSLCSHDAYILSGDGRANKWGKQLLETSGVEYEGNRQTRGGGGVPQSEGGALFPADVQGRPQWEGEGEHGLRPEGGERQTRRNKMSEGKVKGTLACRPVQWSDRPRPDFSQGNSLWLLWWVTVLTSQVGWNFQKITYVNCISFFFTSSKSSSSTPKLQNGKFSIFHHHGKTRSSNSSVATETIIPPSDRWARAASKG